MKTRIKLLRKTLGKNQEEFGEPMNFALTTISGYERTGNIPDYAINAICRTYNVRREWLETGVGEIFEEPAAPTQTPEEFAKAFGCDDFTAGIFARYCRFSDDDKARFSDLLKALIADPDSVVSPKGNKSGLVVKNQVNGDRNSIVNNVSPK